MLVTIPQLETPCYVIDVSRELSFVRLFVCLLAMNIKYRNLAAINISGMYDSVVIELTFAREVYIVVQLTPQLYLHTMKKTVFSVSKVVCAFEVYRHL